MKKTHQHKNLASVLGGGEKTMAVVSKARRLTEATRRLGATPCKPEIRLAPPLGTTRDRFLRYKPL